MPSLASFVSSLPSRFKSNPNQINSNQSNRSNDDDDATTTTRRRDDDATRRARAVDATSDVCDSTRARRASSRRDVRRARRASRLNASSVRTFGSGRRKL